MPTHILLRLFAVLVITFSLSCTVVFAQKDTWIPANPTRVVPTQLSVANCNKKATVAAGWLFNDGGYRVTQQQVVSRSGQTISLDSRVEETTGVRTLSVTPFQKNFD